MHKLDFAQLDWPDRFAAQPYWMELNDFEGDYMSELNFPQDIYREGDSWDILE